MSQQSILVSVDGSVYSRYAANLCWLIAKSTGAKVTALHVVDTAGAADYAAQQPPGFLEVGDYENATAVICEEMRILSRHLASAYMTEASRHGVTTDFIVEEGNPVSVITEMASRYDLLVIGHRPGKEAGASAGRKHFQRLSVAEALSHDCPVPLLIVQEETPLWSEMTVLLSTDHLNEQYVDSCLGLARALNVKSNLLCLSSGVNEEPAETFVKDMKQANPNLADVDVEVAMLEDVALVGGQAFPGHCAIKPDHQQMIETLPVLPTRALGGSRVTVLGGSPALLVRFLGLSTILLLPEEHLLKTPPPVARV